MFHAILQAIQSHDRIIIHRHNRPDGDALGSQIGMKQRVAEKISLFCMNRICRGNLRLNKHFEKCLGKGKVSAVVRADFGSHRLWSVFAL